jgi:hypothetical protein
MIKINHARLFSLAFRTSIIFVSGFLIYEILLRLEKKWNQSNPENQIYHLYQQKIYKLILIFIIDLVILYGLIIFFKIHH